MLIYIAAFEFICSQSPTSMIGLFIGLFYAIKGLFQLIATILLSPFWTCFHGNWFFYFLVNIIIGVVAIIVYVCVARRYEYRKSPVISINMLKIISPIHSRKNTMIMIKLLVLIMSKILL